MAAQYELAVREKINHFTGKSWFVVTELETGEELVDVDVKAEAECNMLRMIEKEPGKFFTSQDVVRGDAYRISPTGAGSSKFGVCEVCNKHADSVYIFTRYVRRYSSIKKAEVLCHKGSAFGHKECLSSLTEKPTT